MRKFSNTQPNSSVPASAHSITKRHRPHSTKRSALESLALCSGLWATIAGLLLLLERLPEHGVQDRIGLALRIAVGKKR